MHYKQSKKKLKVGEEILYEIMTELQVSISCSAPLNFSFVFQ